MKLAELLADPTLVAEVPREAIPALRAEVAAIDTVLLGRLFNAKEPEAAGDRLLDVVEASQRLGVSENYLYRHSDELSFTRRIGRKLLFSSRGIEKHIERIRR